MRAGLLPDLEQRIGRWLDLIARWLAYLGGSILIGVALLTVASIIGRASIALGLGPIPGDIELSEMFGAVAVFLFLPFCQMRLGHVTVDVFTDRARPAIQNACIGLGQVFVFIAAALIAWRHWLGLGEKLQYGETTFILGVPIWVGYAGAMVGAFFFASVALYTVWRGFNAWRTSMANVHPEASA
jgi:TRAP-type C4-dicarboxylate transport system permease small subunit